jgi:hypothetical protein
MSIINFDPVNHLSLADGTPIEQCRLAARSSSGKVSTCTASSTSNSHPHTNAAHLDVGADMATSRCA